MLSDSVIDVLMRTIGSNHLSEQVLVGQPVPGLQGRWPLRLGRSGCFTFTCATARAVQLLSDDLGAEVHALVADVDTGPSDEFDNVKLALAQNEQLTASELVVRDTVPPHGHSRSG